MTGTSAWGDKPAPGWFRLRAEKWLSMTVNLNPVETTALMAITIDCHQRGKPIAGDPARLAKRCHSTRAAMEKAITTLISEGLIARSEAGLWASYVDEEIANAQKRAEVASQNVSKRWGKNKQNQGEKNTTETQTHRVTESQEGEGENPPSPTPDRSSSTLDRSEHSTIDSVDQEPRADRAAPNQHTDYCVCDDFYLPKMGLGSVVKIVSRNPKVLIVQACNGEGRATEYRVSWSSSGALHASEVDYDDNGHEVDDETA